MRVTWHRAGVRPYKLTSAAGTGIMASENCYAVIDVNAQDGYTVRDQVMCDLLHLFNVTLRTYKPLQAAEGGLDRHGSTCACAPGQPCTCRPAAAQKLSHLQADAQVGAPQNC